MLENERNQGQIHVFKEETSHYCKESSHAVQNSFKKKKNYYGEKRLETGVFLN